ncbi:hypothetical protein [Burkholderia ubonensis]|uniref:hypothetical protein n=1 Tax=Burkholderia ubonensis TaxID=101571 RepID=UPI000A440190|nr:hypothetical protein [Burkholderia ubonensis]
MSEEKQLTLPERAAVALGAPKYEQELRDLVAKSATITEVKNKDGREQCHGAMMTLKNTRVAIEKAAKAAREDATAFSKAVIAEEKRLVALAEPEETRLQDLRDAWDAEVEREKAAKAAAEKARVDGIRKRIAEIQAIPAMLVGKQSATIAAAIEGLEAVEIAEESFGEFADEAKAVHLMTVSKLNDMLSAQVAHEAEQARLAAEREELARLRVEQEERDRQAAAARAEQEAKDRAERERIEAEQRAAREAEETRLRAEREAHEAELRRQREAAEAELRRQREAEEALLAEQRAELARQQAVITAAQEEQERKAREAAEAAEQAARAEAERIAAEQAAIAQTEADRIFAEQQRIAAEQAAAEAERIRRELVEFETTGPEPAELLQVLADHYDVSIEVAKHWLGRHVWMEIAA